MILIHLTQYKEITDVSTEMGPSITKKTYKQPNVLACIMFLCYFTRTGAFSSMNRGYAYQHLLVTQLHTELAMAYLC